MRHTSAIGAILLFMLACAVPSWAQFDTASVLGYVHDETGAAISSAKVTLFNTETGSQSSAQANAQGAYEFSSVKIGDYQVIAKAEGFMSTETGMFSVSVNSRQRVDLTLKLGAPSETVTVNGVAELVETDTSSRGQVIDTDVIQNMPLNGRAYADLMLLVPGVRRNNLENQTVTSRDASYNVNGQRSEFNNFLLDGLDNNAYGTSNQGFSNQAIPPSPDAINEFRAETNNYSAEFGRASGAVINVSINSGTNQLHGHLWEYHRNTVLNAIGPFSAPTSALTGKSQKPVLIRNQFGFAVGGPLLRNRLFFFADYEGNRQTQGQYTTATIPNDNQRKGIFTTTAGVPVKLRNPITGAIYADGIVPQSDWTPLAKLVIAALPSASIASYSNNFISVPKASLADNKGDIRVDFNKNANTTLFGRYSQHNGDIVDAGSISGEAGDGGNGNIHAYNRQIAAGYTRILNSSSVLDARVGFTWTEGGKTPYLSGQTSLNTEAGIPGLPTDPLVIRRLSYESVTNFTGFGAQTSNPQFQNPFVINPKINYTKMLGRHSLKFGWEFMKIDTAVNDFNPVYGSESFAGAFSQYGSGTSDTGASQAAYLTDFLLGARSSYQLNNFVIVNYHQRMNFFYAQDDWRVSPKLTINAGLRYELVTPQYTDGNHLANFDPDTKAMIQAKSGSMYDRALVHTPKFDFAPRFGLAYQIADGMVIRAAYGLSFDQFNREGGENLLAYNGPYIVNTSVTQVAPYAWSSTGTPQALCTGENYLNCFRTVAQGYANNFVSSSNYSTLLSQTRYIPKDIPTGYVQTWHLDLQKQLGANSMLSASYIGSHGVHIWTLGDYNQAVPNAAGKSLSVQARRPLSNFTTIEVSNADGELSYNALQAKFERKFSSGLYLLNSFSWSHAIDNASGHLDAPNGDNSRINQANKAGDRGQSAYNQPLNDTLSVVWNLPFGRGQKFAAGISSAVDNLIGGWQLTAVNTASSGQPINLSYSPSAAYTLSSLLTQRPNVSGDPINPSSKWVKSATSLTGYLNSSNVSVPTDVTQPYGNAGRNSIRGMSFHQLDLGIHKSVRVWGERYKLDLRGEAFNLLNHVNYAAPTSNRSSGSFGSITSFFPPRQLQLAVKILF